MSNETLSATITIDAPADAIFALLADPGSHPTIDGTGWLREALDHRPVTGTGQVFRMAMYHERHPDKNYTIANLVHEFEQSRLISWKPGQQNENGDVEVGGWVWRYDLEPRGSGTEVTLTYDWSDAPQQVRDVIPFPPFDPAHLDNSLGHLAELAE